MSKEICIRCGHLTPYDIHTPISSRLYYVEGSGQFCEQCFSQLYSSSSDSSLISAQAKKTEEREEHEQIITITLPTPAIPTLPDQELYNQLINKPTLTDEDREELARLYKKYTV